MVSIIGDILRERGIILKTPEQEALEQRKRAEQEAAKREAEAAEATQRRLEEAGILARERMVQAGQPTAAEEARLARYTTKAITPGETLLTQTGPISQAVARRIQERVETPGLDYMRDLPAYQEAVTAPVWRALKARGIVPPPGTEGGLATQQAFVGIEPALAALRQQAISEDIARGEAYGARAYQAPQFYEQLENLLAEAMRGRLYGAEIGGAEAAHLGAREAAPYTLTAAERLGFGEREAARLTQEYETLKAERARQKEERKQEEKVALMKQIGELAGDVLLTYITGGAYAPVAIGKGVIKGGVGGTTQTVPGFGQVWSPYGTETPYSRALAQRIGR